MLLDSNTSYVLLCIYSIFWQYQGFHIHVKENVVTDNVVIVHFLKALGFCLVSVVQNGRY